MPMKGKLTINVKDITKILSDKIHSTIFNLFVTDNGHTELMLRSNIICQYWPQTLLQCNVLFIFICTVFILMRH